MTHIFLHRSLFLSSLPLSFLFALSFLPLFTYLPSSLSLCLFLFLIYIISSLYTSLPLKETTLKSWGKKIKKLSYTVMTHAP